MSESLERQYRTIKAETINSNVTQYGAFQLVSMKIGDFEGNLTSIHHHHPHSHHTQDPKPKGPFVNSRDIKWHFLKWQRFRSRSLDGMRLSFKLLQEEEWHRKDVDTLWQSFSVRFNVSLNTPEGHPSNCGSCCHRLFETVSFLVVRFWTFFFVLIF